MTAGSAVRLLLLAAALTTGQAAAAPGLPERIDAAMSAGDYAAARPLAEQWLNALERQPGKKLETARVRHVLGSIRDRLGDHAAAQQLLETAAADYVSAAAPAGDLAACQDEAGRAALGAGDFAAAERWLTKSMAARTGAMASVSRSVLAEVLLRTGRADEARRAWNQALTEAEGDDSARCFALRGLGLHAHTMGGWDEAVKQFRAAREAAAAFGPEAPAMMAALDGQAGQSLLRAGRRSEAAPLLESAASWFSAHPGSPDEKAAAWNNLATLWMEENQSAKAADKLKEVLADATLAASPQALTLWLNLAAARQRSGTAEAAGALQSVEALAARHLPAVHPLRAQLALTAATLAADAGDQSAAARLAGEASRQAILWMEKAAASPDESLLLDFHATMDPVSPPAALATRNPEGIAAAVLAAQEAVPEILLTRRRWEHLAGEAALTAWRLQPEQTPGPPARIVPDPAALCAALPDNAVMVNYFHWRPYQGRGVWDRNTHCGALVMARKTPVRMVDLGPAAPIENRIRRLITAARDAVAAGAETPGRTSLTWQLTSLHGMLWKPLGLPDDPARRVLLRADGLLHFVPWAVLANAEGPPLCRTFPDFEVIVFPREATPEPAPAARWRILAAASRPVSEMPEFSGSLPALLSPSLLDSLREMPALPGVDAEVSAIREAAGSKVTVETPNAAEAAFALPDKNQPSVIHFAGHGFVCEEASGGASLLRAGLVMSDCAAGLRDLAAGKTRPHPVDGLLFASDAAALPLNGRPLIVLSGCQTGLGHWRSGGQLAGLRHSFLIAGAGTVASTLWDLNDATAPELVRLIYARLAAGAPPSAAVWQAQREWLQSPAALALTQGMRAARAGAWISESAGWRRQH